MKKSIKNNLMIKLSFMLIKINTVNKTRETLAQVLFMKIQTRKVKRLN